MNFKATYRLDHPSSKITFDKDNYSKQHLDISFVDQDDYPTYELSEDEPIREMGLPNRSRLSQFVHSASVQNINLSVNPFTQSESTSSDSDDETVLQAYSAPTNYSSNTEDGEIVENSDINNDGSVEIDYILDYVGDISANTILQEGEETKENEDESLLNTLDELCIQLDSELDENPDARDNNE
jgi:hypothetical protein